MPKFCRNPDCEFLKYVSSGYPDDAPLTECEFCCLILTIEAAVIDRRKYCHTSECSFLSIYTNGLPEKFENCKFCESKLSYDLPVHFTLARQLLPEIPQPPDPLFQPPPSNQEFQNQPLDNNDTNATVYTSTEGPDVEASKQCISQTVPLLQNYDVPVIPSAPTLDTIIGPIISDQMVTEIRLVGIFYFLSYNDYTW